MLLVPMAGNTLFLAVATSTVQVAAYSALLWRRVWCGRVTNDMFNFAAQQWTVLIAIGICEGLFYPAVFASAARLPGGLVQVLNQAVVPYTVIFSQLLLGRRFGFTQLLGVVVVMAGVLSASGLLSSFLGFSTFQEQWQGHVAWKDVVLCTSAYSLLALAVTLKDSLFKRFQKKVGGQGQLDVLLVCTAAAIVQLITQLLVWPFFSPGRDAFAAGFRALAGFKEPIAPWLALLYWTFNISFSLCALKLVSQASAAAVVLANVVALPISALLFCCNLPLLGPQAFRWNFATSLMLVVAGNLLYSSASFLNREKKAGTLLYGSASFFRSRGSVDSWS
ncbi:unnamed protein product [Polarella glacialis]|uniref:EamA domain-containing protein n=1 Tax=Polarella glacialis TaxID=89957 RepID=A0A813JQN6_POLGL|nr:unnamed protein product [Polarella glacialis]